MSHPPSEDRPQMSLGHRNSSRSIYRSRLDAALDVQRQLTAQEALSNIANRKGLRLAT
jgi:hypothetical protein